MKSNYYFHNDMKSFLWYWNMYLTHDDDWYKHMAEIQLAQAKMWFRWALMEKQNEG